MKRITGGVDVIGHSYIGHPNQRVDVVTNAHKNSDSTGRRTAVHSHPHGECPGLFELDFLEPPGDVCFIIEPRPEVHRALGGHEVRA